ncbi:hypothetical protein OVS_03460 [Mycoplasma ovis str. Michigan]|uniref:Uncharacterized protein n=1 Tax=Mycoplasma ovis str. Michigan TaxID=1415773 RepID=A0ABN4BN64_9MOLU|nr:hypothetical protein [Mycoplasma ovis]AHC40441.1 hypothetical protein OVS_03460 [Mycoplasma ovis str. Michigan]
MGFLLEHWQELCIFVSAISIPIISLLTGSSIINWSKPSGYYTQATLTIENGSSGGAVSTSSGTGSSGIKDYQLIQVGALESQPSTKSFDLVAEFPLKYLDKQNWWRYCLPKSSKLKNGSATTNFTSEQDCVLNWWRKTDDSNSESIFYLLDLMLKFLKLQHQVNLITLFHSSSNPQQVSTTTSDNGNDVLSKIKETCNLSNSSSQNSLSYMFTSSTPISKNCLITPIRWISP